MAGYTKTIRRRRIFAAIILFMFLLISKNSGSKVAKDYHRYQQCLHLEDMNFPSNEVI